MSAVPSIKYTQRLNTSPDAEISALASVYAFILQKHQEKQKGTRRGFGGAGTKGSNDDRDYMQHCT